MPNVSTKVQNRSSLGLFLIKAYIAFAFVVWKLINLYIYTDSGLLAKYTASQWSLAIGVGYILCVTFFLNRLRIQVKSGQREGIAETFIFSGLGLWFLLLGFGISYPAINSFGAFAILGINGLLLFYSWQGWRQFKGRAFGFWVWGYSLSLVCGLGERWYAAVNTPIWGGSGKTGWLWNLAVDLGLNIVHAEWLLNFFWLGNLVSSVLIVAGLVVLIQQLRLADSRNTNSNLIRNVVASVVLLLIGAYPSRAYFGSAGLLTTCTTNAVMLYCAITAYRRFKMVSFALWAWAAGITLLLTIGGHFQHVWRNPPPAVYQVIGEAWLVLGLVSGIFWVVGMILLLRNLGPAKSLHQKPSATAPQLAIFPKPPGRMRKRLAVIMALGGIVISVVWFWQHDPAQVLSIEPKYEGKTFSYWMEHWYQEYGRRNLEAEAALSSMGTKAVPYLVKWIKLPPRYSPGLNHPEQALRGFEVLGPVAKSAVPDLIKIIGTKQGYAMRALVCIGSNAVPALSEKLMETLPDTSPPVMNWRNRRYETGVAHVQACVIQTLGNMGTAAEAALPALTTAAKSKNWWTQAEAFNALVRVGQNQPDRVISVLIDAFTNSNTGEINQGNIVGDLAVIGKRHPDMVIPVLISALTNSSAKPVHVAAVVGALASVGHNHPTAVVPVLISVFTNYHPSSVSKVAVPSRPIYRNAGSDHRQFIPLDNSFEGVRASVADALSTFGQDARAAIPLLLLAGQGGDANLRARAAVAVQNIAPETPYALAPLIKNLTEKDVQVQEQALRTLESLGTNAVEALPAITEKCLLHPVLNIRTAAMRCISAISRISDEGIRGLYENAIHPNESVAQQAVASLFGFAGQSRLALLQLFKAIQTSPVIYVRQNQGRLASMVENNPTLLIECLKDADSQTRYQALLMIDSFGFRTPALPDAATALKKALQDEQAEVRVFATNMSLKINQELYGNQVAELLVYNRNLNATNSQGQTALHVQILTRSYFQKAAIQALLDAGADPNVRDVSGRTPAHLLLTETWPWENARGYFSLLAKSGANLAVADNKGQTPLHYLAALGGQSPLFFIGGIADCFVSAKVDIQPRDLQGDTPLHIAIRSGTTDVYDWLLKRGADLDATNDAGETPRLLVVHNKNSFIHSRPSSGTDVFQAVREGNLDALKMLFKADPKLVNEPNQFKLTPLRLAVMGRRTNIVDFLVQQGAGWDAVSAVMIGRTEVLRDILTQQPSVATNTPDLLRIAAANGDLPTVELLLGAGADLRAVDRWGLSPVGYARLRQHNQVANLLIRHGAVENIFDASCAGHFERVAALIDQKKSLARATNDFGLSPGEIAVAIGRTDILQIFLNNGVKVDFSNPVTGQKLLHVAAIWNQTNAAAMLIQLKAAVDAYDNRGFTPLHWAANQGSTEVAELLLKYNANPNAHTSWSSTNRQFRGMLGIDSLAGESPLHLAALNGQTNIIELLLKSGASINAPDSQARTALDMARAFGLPQRQFMMQSQFNRMWEPLMSHAAEKTNMFPAVQARQKAAADLLESSGGKPGQHRKFPK